MIITETGKEVKAMAVSLVRCWDKNRVASMHNIQD
jgi:hypothetical protein